ncbi:PD-(D/E)XK nuclease family protein [Chroococcus sp. FPU101]|uniref:PD-(D/E)XK nuclease family protein n=1 Tax=Chroococcus sp. FPU101 TaxID=1974212 RepID=UPI001A8E24A9|nr:PD-(D/E)XK nuclease family protein [Chroococcus sp. FPU101]GFE67946.1 hypothetical protein CFPU101_05560 [Chroococcus sp. FPU101]
MAQNPSFSVTKVKVAFECPRLFYLGHKFGGKLMCNSPEKTLGIGITYHGLAEKCLDAMRHEPKFSEFLEGSPEQINQEKLNQQIKNLLYELIFLPYLREIKKNYHKKVDFLLKLWQGLTSLIDDWTTLLILNRHFCSADKVIKKTFILQEYVLKYNFKLPNNQEQIVRGKLDSLIFNFSRNRLAVVDYKTYPASNAIAQFVQVALYSYMLQQTKGIPVDAQVSYIFPNLKTDFYSWEKLEETIYQSILYKLQQMQEWLTWESGDSEPPPATIHPHLCNLCPQKRKCQSFFENTEAS